MVRCCHPPSRRGPADDEGDEAPCIDARGTKLSRLAPGEDFVYMFDFGDGWHHLCTVGEQRIDPLTTVGFEAARPLPYWGWGDPPDQYGRRWAEDDGESPVPANPKRADLPPFFPWWGAGADRYPD